MPAPKYIVEAIAAMKEERGPLAARLDAIDLAIDNISRVYGLHGTPQPLPLERRATERRVGRKPKIVKGAGDSGDAAERRAVILAAIAKAPVGLTAVELRSMFKMKPQDRANALFVLKRDGQIKRAGNTWVKAA